MDTMTMSPSLAIVIPTHKRALILRECLERIDRQSIRDTIEIIVVSDGHDEETRSMIETRPKNTVPVQYVEQEKSHQGTARNAGVKMARAPLVLFLGDDMFLEPHACAMHMDAHERCRSEEAETAVLGYATWDPLLKKTPVMAWLDRTGWQFDYASLERCRRSLVPLPIQEYYTYTSHVSLSAKIAKEHPFREDLSLYGWEDMEWGLRLKNAGVRLFYEPSAIAFHHHPMTLEDSLQRMETLGRSANVIAKVSPFDPRPKGWKLLAYEILSMLPTMRGEHAKAFLRGMKKNIL